MTQAWRTSIERLLRAKGYATIAFALAEEFLRGAGVDGAVGLVLDIHLAGISGIELRCRLAAAGSTTPVVFITAPTTTRRRATRRWLPVVWLTCANRSTRPN
ncbi:MAG TPA: hypothetical protein VMG60_00215 [Burkholderiaceae bacterium]|nr:hypothetical protein [Burkholderiaceae bacterium]